MSGIFQKMGASYKKKRCLISMFFKNDFITGMKDQKSFKIKVTKNIFKKSKMH